METPLISVIVPIYNVAPFLRKCLDSLAVQTLSDIEIILIDDGSTDQSCSIADLYAATDQRFRCIHTIHGGISAARNRGIEESKSEWIMFVDSDDWVEPYFCQIPYEKAVHSNADLVIFGWFTENNGNLHRIKQKKMPIGVIDEYVAYETGGVITWNKLYKKSLFERLQYPIGRVYEDIATTHKIVHMARRIVSINTPLYHHVLREDSISHTHTKKYTEDCFVVTIQKCNDLFLYGFPEEIIQILQYRAAIGYLSRIKPCNDDYYVLAKQLIDSIDGVPKGLSIKQILVLILWRTDKKLFCFLCKLMGRI